MLSSTANRSGCRWRLPKTKLSTPYSTWRFPSRVQLRLWLLLQRDRTGSAWKSIWSLFHDIFHVSHSSLKCSQKNDFQDGALATESTVLHLLSGRFDNLVPSILNFIAGQGTFLYKSIFTVIYGIRKPLGHCPGLAVLLSLYENRKSRNVWRSSDTTVVVCLVYFLPKRAIICQLKSPSVIMNAAASWRHHCVRIRALFHILRKSVGGFRQFPMGSRW